MTILILDCGNSRIKTAVYDKKQCITADVIDTAPEQQLLDIVEQHVVTKIYVSSVRTDEAMQTLLNPIINKRRVNNIQFAKSESSYKGLRNGYKKPTDLGVDRWLAMIAAYEKYGASFIIIDAGTALTFDRVDDKGQHLGGYIIPGFQSATASLFGRTNISKEKPSLFSINIGRGLGHTTDSCVTQGISKMYQSFLKSLVHPDVNCDNVIVTGGDRMVVKQLLDEVQPCCPLRIEKNLVIDGLRCYFDL